MDFMPWKLRQPALFSPFPVPPVTLNFSLNASSFSSFADVVDIYLEECGNNCRSTVIQCAQFLNIEVPPVRKTTVAQSVTRGFCVCVCMCWSS